MLRMGATLDLGTILQEVVNSARALTDARYAIIATVDEAGDIDEYVTSGFTAAETRAIAEWPDGPRLFAHLHGQSGPLQLADLPDYVRELGFSAKLMRSNTLQAMPVQHRDERVGSFFLAEKTDTKAFTAEDEEVLALFAAQAAAAIVHARALRREQRARTDLEALIETSPVGVVVLDAKSGRLVSFNAAALRIAAPLLTRDAPPEQTLGTLTCRFANGREVMLGESPLAGALGDARTLRAEEVELTVPDGGTVRTLINVTPIRSSSQGEIVSVLVTLQDLEPFEELERQRAAFLGMVSQELRTPLAAIKGSSAAALGATRSPSQGELMQSLRIVDAQADHMHDLIGNLLDAGRIEAGTLSVHPAPAEVAVLAEVARNTFVAGGARHQVRIDLPDDLPPVLADGERIAQVIGNLLSNAARHAPESSPITITAAHEGTHVAVSVRDEGHGVPPELLGRLFTRHAALAESGARGGVSPSGLGLAICKGLVEAHGGRIRAESAGLGRGALFTFTLPVAPDAPVQPKPAQRRRGAQPAKARILVIDDDPHTLRAVRHALHGAGYGVVETGEPGQVTDLLRAEQPHLVLLDLMLPGTDGIELMAQIPELSDVPVIFISAYGRDDTIARAFSAGAADYIVKPFSPTELTARVGAALRGRAATAPFVLGELAIDYERRRVTVGEREVALTATEYELLRILSAEAPRVVTAGSLLRQAWGNRLDPGAERDTHRLRSFVRKLRHKLGDDTQDPRWILNVRGVGYRMGTPEVE